MEEKKILITVKKDGKIKIDFIGFKGQTCDVQLFDLEKVLGELLLLENEEKKPEYYTNQFNSDEITESS